MTVFVSSQDRQHIASLLRKLASDLETFDDYIPEIERINNLVQSNSKEGDFFGYLSAGTYKLKVAADYLEREIVEFKLKQGE